jgi:hypothetical protein
MHFAEAASQFNIPKEEEAMNTSAIEHGDHQPIVRKLRLCTGGGPLVIAHPCCGAAATDKDRRSLSTQTRHDDLKPPTFLRRCFDIAE